MPLVSPERSAQYWEPVAGGPVAQADLSSATYASPQGTVPTTTPWYTSSVINADGFKFITVAATSSQAGAINVQLYVDATGTIKQGAVQTVAVLAATPVVLNVNASTTPFQSFTVQITNTGGSPANITNYALLMTAA